MAKLVNVRERVHQPVSDFLVRTSGQYEGNLADQTSLFQGQGLIGSKTVVAGALPSDQSMCILAIRVMVDYRIATNRGNTVVVPGGTNYPITNGDIFIASTGATGPQSNIMRGSAPANNADVARLHYQTQDQLFWTMGVGLKPSLTDMPTAYFPYGGGLHGRDPHRGSGAPVVLQNGSPDNTAICRVARAILVPPRQNFASTATIAGLPDGGNGSVFRSVQTQRNMLSLKDNLNAPDMMQKTIIVALDGLLSRDVQ